MLREADTQGRFHAYYPHVEGLCDGTCLDLHSKVMIVDDEWLRIGSSNLSNRSMGVDSECDVTVEAEGRPEVRAAVRGVRDRLVAEHAGVPYEQMARALAQAPRMADAIKALSTGERRLVKLEAPEVTAAKMAAAAIGDMEKPISFDALAEGLAHDEPPLVEHAPTKTALVIGTLLLFIASLAFAWRFTPLSGAVTPERVIQAAETLSAYWWAPLVMVLVYTPACLVLFPRPLLTMAAVIVFGPVEGLLYAMAGVLIAGVVGYAIGRLVHRDTVRRVAGPRLHKLTGVLQRRGLLAVTVVRFVPLAPFAVVNIVMGAMRIKLWHFVLGTFFGMLPGALAATILSDQAAAMLREPARVNPWLIGAAVAAFITLAWSGGMILKRMDPDRKRRTGRPQPAL
jgi:uncharacterized membrane protein YdjX (TVP38/TMEM64 family)